MPNQQRSKRLVMAASVSVLVLGLWGGVAAAETHDLQIRLDAGSSFRFATETEQEILVDMLGMNQASTTESRFEMTQNVGKRDDEGITPIDVVFDRVSMESRQGESVLLSYDSDKPSEGNSDEVAGMLGAMIGKTMTMRLSPRGEVVGVGGLSDLWDGMLDDENPQLKPLTDMLRSSFGDDQMGQLMQAGMAVFPAEPVAEGASWAYDAKVTHAMLGTIETNGTYTLEGLENRDGEDCYRLGVVVAMKFGDDMPMLEAISAMAETSMDVDIKDTESKGTMWISRATGLTVASEMRQEMKMSIGFSIPDQGEQSMEMTMNQTARMSLIQ